MKLSEADIHRQIVEYFDVMGIFCFHIPNERNSSMANMRNLKKLGLRSGAPDLEVWLPTHNGVRIVYMEIKSENGKLSENQKAFRERCEKAGLPYHVVRSLDNVIDIVNEVKKEIGK